MRIFNQIGPERLQGSSAGKGRIYVGPGSKFQNIHQRGETATAAELTMYVKELEDYAAGTFWRRLKQLHGKDLVCSCSSGSPHCHGQWLLDHCNAAEPFLG